jgi:hypothetical protein
VQKSRKRSEPSTSYAPRHRSVSLPEMVTIDVLSTMLDEDLVVRLRALDDSRGQIYESHMDMRPWEEEIAYVRREQQIRRTRRDTHSDYVRKSEDEFNRLEAVLPAGDFDNSAFVYAASGGRPRWTDARNN